jgi:hypothetical protein
MSVMAKTSASKAAQVRKLAVYSGRDRLGAIVQNHDDWSAFGPTGRRLGTFKSRALALSAIDEIPIAGGIAPRARRRVPAAKAAVLSGRANG